MPWTTEQKIFIVEAYFWQKSIHAAQFQVKERFGCREFPVQCPLNDFSVVRSCVSYGTDFKFPNCIVTYTLFCIGHNFEIIIRGEMLGTPTQCHTFVIYDDTGQKTHLD